jgi:hypothetical protein
MALHAVRFSHSPASGKNSGIFMFSALQHALYSKRAMTLGTNQNCALYAVMVDIGTAAVPHKSVLQ